MKIKKEAVYLSADDEQQHYVTHAGVKVDENGFITDSWVPVRYNGELLEVPVEKVEFIDMTPLQAFGTSASLIPFLAHDMPARALMGTHMQCQAVPLVSPSSPYVGTGIESIVPQALKRTVMAPEDGKVTVVDSKKLVIQTKSNKEYSYKIEKFKRTSQNTCFSQSQVFPPFFY